MDLSHLSIWSAALMAAATHVQQNGINRGVQWQPASDHVRYEAAESETVEPFGVQLAAGDVLEVRWHPGETSYSTTVTSNRRVDA